MTNLRRIIGKYNAITIIFSLFFSFVFCNCSAEDVYSQSISVYADTVRPHYYTPQIPQSFTVFDEQVDLTNYYLRERFDRELMSFCYWHSQVLLIIKRANKFFPVIEPILKEEGVPDDFKYLAVIESSLDQRALSPAKAAGIWQILATTGQENGLIVNEDVDERYNLEKATVVACRYLRRTYELTGSWTLAAASYNSGRARVLKQMEVQQTDNYYDMLFGEETNRYVFRIMMAKFVMEHPQDFGFILKKEDLYRKVEMDKIRVDTTINNLTSFAKGHGISYMLLKDANPWLRTNKMVNKERKEFFIDMPKCESLGYDAEKIQVSNENWIINP